MSDALKVLRLHLLKREMVIAVPVFILALVIIISVLISIAASRFGVDVTSAQWQEGFANNGGAVWSIPGFLVYIGVQAVSTTFPFGMALGTTRSAYSGGTALYFLLQSSVIGLLGLVLLIVERWTNGWFVHARVFDVLLLGNGSPWKVFATLTAIAFFSLTVGSVFGALFVKAGAKGPLILAIAVVLVLAVLLVVFAPQLGEIVRKITRVDILLTLIGIGVAAIAGQYAALRVASVR